jgi:hypothetical protein
MKLWSWLRNHDKLNTLEDELHGMSEALKVANLDVKSLTDLHNKQHELVKKLTEELEQLTVQKIQVMESIQENIAGPTVSFGFVPEEEHVSITDLSKTMNQDYVYVQ